MKNHNEMYQSLLSRYEEYQEKKKRHLLTVKRAVPVLACFCFCAVLGLGYWNHIRNLPSILVQPDVRDETTIEATETTIFSESGNTSKTQITNQTEPIFTTAPTSELETDFITATTSIQAQTTAVVTVFSETQSTVMSISSSSGEMTTATQNSESTQPITTETHPTSSQASITATTSSGDSSTETSVTTGSTVSSSEPSATTTTIIWDITTYLTIPVWQWQQSAIEQSADAKCDFAVYQNGIPSNLLSSDMDLPDIDYMVFDCLLVTIENDNRDVAIVRGVWLDQDLTLSVICSPIHEQTKQTPYRQYFALQIPKEWHLDAENCHADLEYTGSDSEYQSRNVDELVFECFESY